MPLHTVRMTKFIFTERCVSKDPPIIPTYARAILFYGCPVVRVNTPGLLQQSHVWYSCRVRSLRRVLSSKALDRNDLKVGKVVVLYFR